MPRVLATCRSARGAVPEELMLTTARARRSVARQHDAHYWLFSDAHPQGAITEFVEAADADRLDAALMALATIPGLSGESRFTRSTEFVLD
jgi:hypothetical protein